MDAARPRRYVGAMVRRRAIFDPWYRPTSLGRLVVRNMPGAVLESRPILPSAELKRAFVAAAH